jgi:predicted amidophosphoribosyltransferase
MPIRVIIVDASKTILNDEGCAVPGIGQLLAFCRSRNVKIVINSNQDELLRKVDRAGLPYDLLVGRRDVGIRKPSRKYVDIVLTKFNVRPTEVVYLGDDDKTDAYCAANGKVLYLSALWANPDPKYGIRLRTPSAAIKFLELFLLKEHLWACTIEQDASDGRPIKWHSLVHFNDCSETLKNAAVNTFKFGSSTHHAFFLNSMMSSIYLSGFHERYEYWATYPGHSRGGSLNPAMAGYLEIFSKEFRDKYIDLFIRHTTAHDSGSNRYAGDAAKINLPNQIETVCLNPAFQEKIQGSTFLIIDDFTTKGYSFECARHLLLEASASDVACLCVGKYGFVYHSIVRGPGCTFDPFEPIRMFPYETEVIRHSYSREAGANLQTKFDDFKKYISNS